MHHLSHDVNLSICLRIPYVPRSPKPLGSQMSKYMFWDPICPKILWMPHVPNLDPICPSYV
ncbi:hypothetical protein KP509_08G056700 [Ceratopteris richardii]|uniref:Uncharacterized protein n=1 Tax=Ceratopteris richardii TaxID=49495 RepID=A0A8T2U5V4_CERRI|nr:hypothetical protein KP509_08G056700 [Ceratopteris richardii]